MAREVVKDVNAGRAKFVINSGDVVWWGNQGRTVDDSPYWKRVNDTMLKRLPLPDDEMRAAGLDGRWFIGIGNHEVWGDPKIEGTLNAVPYIRKLGVTLKISSTSSTSATLASSSCGAENTITARPRTGTPTGPNTKSRSLT